MRCARRATGGMFRREYPHQTRSKSVNQGEIVRQILNFSAKSTSNCRKCPTFSRSFCPCFFCFHTHNGFQRHLLTSFLVGPSPVVTFNWNRIFTMERRPECCRLGMGSAFSSPDADLPIYYTHKSRLCQVENEATRTPSVSSPQTEVPERRHEVPGRLKRANCGDVDERFGVLAPVLCAAKLSPHLAFRPMSL